MQSFPFNSVEEAKENAKLLCQSFEFYTVQLFTPDGAGKSKKISLQQTQNLIAKALNCRGWTDLKRRLEYACTATYLDQTSEKKTILTALAQKLEVLMGLKGQEENIYGALKFSSFGCSHNRRKMAEDALSVIPYKTVNVHQFGKLQAIEHAYRYHSRYNRDRSAYDIQMLDYSKHVAIAEVLGKPKPRKPMKPRNPKR